MAKGFPRRWQEWLLALAVFLATALPAHAQSSFSRSSRVDLVKEVQLTMNWRTRKNFIVTGIPSSVWEVSGEVAPGASLSLTRDNTFEVDLTIRPHRVLFAGLIFSDHDIEPDPVAFSSGDYCAIQMSRNQLGVIGYLQTGWSNPVPYSPSWLQYRAKAGGVFDITGQKVAAVSGRNGVATNKVDIGRWREHRFFLSLEAGLRNPVLFDRGTFLLRLTYWRSAAAWSASDPASEFKPGGKNSWSVGLGISI